MLLKIITKKLQNISTKKIAKNIFQQFFPKMLLNILRIFLKNFSFHFTFKYAKKNLLKKSTKILIKKNLLNELCLNYAN